jgi:uncharacterized protein
MKIPRIYSLKKNLKPNQVLVIYGPRRVGKTTLLMDFLSKTNLKYKLDSGDSIKVQQVLSSQDFEKIFDHVEGYELVAIDEAQYIPNISMGLKIMVDQIKGIKIIATGSSSFQLSGQIGEPLTGRKKTLILYPVSQIELLKIKNSSELRNELANYLIYGSYPSVVSTGSKQGKRDKLEEVVNSYLLQDILALEKVKGSKVLLDLLRLIAFQIGSEVSLSELGTQVGLDTKTVARYLDLFEKSFVLYNLRGYSRNLRSEIVKKSKYYFYDNGIRNAVISNFNSLELRDDIGRLWENFLVAERLKKQTYNKIYANNFFWRTWQGQEIDWIEEREGKLFGFEFKYKAEKYKIPKLFLKTYPEGTVKLVNKNNYLKFIS